MRDKERAPAFWVCLLVFGFIAAYVIGDEAGPIGTPHFVVWLAVVTVAAVAIRRYLYPPKR